MKRKYKCMRQLSEADCGAACLAAICQFYGKTVEMSYLREISFVDKYGANLLGLHNAAEKLGFTAEGLSGNFHDLLTEKIPCPFIAHVIIEHALEHFIVIMSYDKQRIVASDPAQGMTEYTTADFNAIWTGNILTMIPNHKFVKDRSHKSALFNFFCLISGHKKQFVYIVILSFATAGLSISTTYFLSYLLDYIIPKGYKEQLITGTVAMVFIHFLAAAFDLLRTYLISFLTKDMNCELMNDYLVHLLKNRYSFFEKNTTGDLVSRLQDADTVREAISQITVTALLDILTAFIGLGILQLINKKLFAISFIVLICYGITIAVFNRKISLITAELRRRDASVTTSMVETINGIELIKAYQSEDEIREKNQQKIKSLMEIYQKGIFLFSKQSTLSMTIMSIGEILILAAGGINVINRNMSLGTLIMFYALFSMCITPIKNIINLLPMIHKAEISAKRLNDVMNAPHEEECQKKNKTFSLRGDITISNISFRYGNRELVLDNISLTIRQGEKIALIGDSGSGKSTLAKLLLRMYDYNCGNIKINDRLLTDIPIAELRNRIAYIPQKVFLFQGSILNNIKIGNADMDDLQVIRFLDATPLSQYLNSFPMKYHTMLTERGENLSGGQRQVIAVARALIKKADILILDEATNAVDLQTQKIINQAIESVYADASIIMISHQYSSIQGCSRAIILHQGRIAAQGDHRELLKNCMEYRAFCHADTAETD